MIMSVEAAGRAETKYVTCNGDGVVEQIASVVAGGNITVAYDGNVPYQYVNLLIRRLARAGFILTERKYEGGYTEALADFLAPIEAIRLIVALGGGEFACLAAVAAQKKGIKAIYFPTTAYVPDREYMWFYCGGRAVKESCRAFDLVLTDETLTEAANGRAKAAAVGFFLTDALGRFDRLVSELLTSGALNDKKYRYAVNCLDSIGVKGEKQPPSSGGEYGSALLSAELYRFRFPKLGLGEGAFLFAYTLIKLYKRFLERDFCDLAPPKDYGRFVEIMTKKYGGDAVRLLRDTECRGTDEYLLRRHVIGEYRAELYALLKLLDAELPSLLKRFKRMYPDAGYFLKEEIKGKELLECTALGVTLCREDTFAGFLDELGVLNFLQS
ncbi:MAG: hypothetical protein LBT20_07685 [Clostridiales bacterium]|jgi:hypothetical protein|nr:hypothetical protein [Clostridiales bacterium]